MLLLLVDCVVGWKSSGVFCVDADEVTILCDFLLNNCSDGSIDGVDDAINCDECTSDVV